jgi:hypothetical protein
MKWIIWLAIGLLVVLLLTPFFHRWNARRVNDIRQAYITEDANVRVNTYEWFYDMHEQIEATRRKAEIAKGTPEEKGIRMVLASMIAEYNAKSRMTATKAQWKAKDLPYFIEQ